MTVRNSLSQEKIPSNGKQLPLELIHGESHALADFVIADCNREAASYIQKWPDWSGHVTAVVGPKASGKSHLASIWKAITNGHDIREGDDLSLIEPHGCYVLDLRGDGAADENWLFHLFNWTRENGCSLLILSSVEPNRLDVRLPDLKSRLATVYAVVLSEPDDQTLLAVLIKLFSDKQLQVDLSVIDYSIARMERSFEAVRNLVDGLDKMSLAGQRKISKHLARQYFEGL